MADNYYIKKMNRSSPGELVIQRRKVGNRVKKIFPYEYLMIYPNITYCLTSIPLDWAQARKPRNQAEIMIWPKLWIMLTPLHPIPRISRGIKNVLKCPTPRIYRGIKNTKICKCQ